MFFASRNNSFRFLPCLGFLAALTACGTTYQVTPTSEEHTAQARAMFAEEQNSSTAKSGGQLPPSQAVQQFMRVVSRVEPVAEQFCRNHTSDRKDFDCDIEILVDTETPYRNAYQTYDANRTPLIVFTIPMIADARNEDELAFVMGHEVGHHLAEHLKKKEQQRVAGAIIMGVAMAAASSPYTDASINQANIENAAMAGAAIGGSAYGQTYELSPMSLEHILRRRQATIQ